MKKQNRFILYLCVSIGLHLGLVCLIALRTKDHLLNKPNFHQTEIELIDKVTLLDQLKKNSKPDLPTDGQIVEQNKKPINDIQSKDARFLSQFNQKVQHESQAKNHGQFRNSSGESSSSDDNSPAAKSSPPLSPSKKHSTAAKSKPSTHLATNSNGDIPVNDSRHPKLKDLLPSFQFKPDTNHDANAPSDHGAAASAHDDYLKDVEYGAQTLLSTREFVYFSYYNRIKDRLRQFWEPKIKSKMARLLRQGRQLASSGDRITKVIIVLDQSGTLRTVKVIGASGVHDLDDAAVEAFKAAAPFPNPPKGLVEGDGTIKIRWDFILEANNFDFLEKSPFICCLESIPIYT